jgi:hypothetical protein
MRTVKSKKKAYELAERGELLVVDGLKYRKVSIGEVISMFGKVTFYARNR